MRIIRCLSRLSLALDKDEPHTPPLMDMSAALEQFANYRNKQVVVLEGADDITWQKTATHPEYDLSLLSYIMSRHGQMHDYWHMYGTWRNIWLRKEGL